MRESKTACFVIKYLWARQESAWGRDAKTVHVGWKWDGGSYVMRCRAEGRDGLLLERAALSPLKAPAHPEPH